MRSSYKPYVGRRIVVQIGGDTLGGVVAQANADRLVLRDAALIESGPVPMDGEIVIPAAGIRWVQVLG